jgi:hypothetical protein
MRVADLPPSLKLAMYKQLFPHPSVTAVLPANWRQTWGSRLSEQFDFSILDANVKSCLALYEEEFVREFASASRAKPSTVTSAYFYDFGKLTYRCTFELCTFRTKRGLVSGCNVRLSNDGFLYPPVDRLQRVQSGTVANDTTTGW